MKIHYGRSPTNQTSCYGCCCRCFWSKNSVTLLVSTSRWTTSRRWQNPAIRQIGVRMETASTFWRWRWSVPTASSACLDFWATRSSSASSQDRHAKPKPSPLTPLYSTWPSSFPPSSDCNICTASSICDVCSLVRGYPTLTILIELFFLSMQSSATSACFFCLRRCSSSSPPLRTLAASPTCLSVMCTVHFVAT